MQILKEKYVIHIFARSWYLRAHTCCRTSRCHINMNEYRLNGGAYKSIRFTVITKLGRFEANAAISQLITGRRDKLLLFMTVGLNTVQSKSKSLLGPCRFSICISRFTKDCCILIYNRWLLLKIIKSVNNFLLDIEWHTINFISSCKETQYNSFR